jgi:hypothetical protein
MKKISPLLLLLFVLMSCNRSNADRAHELVQNYCNNNFFSPEDYKPLSFDSLKIYVAPYKESAEYAALDKKRQQVEAQKDSLYALMYDGSKKQYHGPSTDSLDRMVAAINNAINTGRENFKGTQKGWIIAHTYNRRDDAGRIVEGRTLFILDKDINKVLQATDE